MNQDALKRRALALGAKLEINGKTFNAARTQGQPVPRPKLVAVATPAAPIAVVQPEPVQPVEQPNESLKAIEQFAGASYLLAESNAKLLDQVQQKLAQPTAKPIRQWLFKINRDTNGNMVSIEATAKE